jgi:hypothetical protein
MLTLKVGSLIERYKYISFGWRISFRRDRDTQFDSKRTGEINPKGIT